MASSCRRKCPRRQSRSSRTKRNIPEPGSNNNNCFAVNKCPFNLADACLRKSILKISTNQASGKCGSWVCIILNSVCRRQQLSFSPVFAQVLLTAKASEGPFHSPGLVLVVVAHRSTTDPNVLVTLVGNAASHIATET